MNTSDYEHGSVPADQRMGWMPIAFVWIAIGIDLSGAFLGIEFAAGMSFWPAIVATLVGSLLLGLLAMACAYVGAVTGLSTAMVSRAVFGRFGGIVLATALAVSLLGWFAVQAGFFGTNAQIAFSELTGVELPVWVFTTLGAVLMVMTALWGYRSISKLSSLAVPLLLVLLVVGIVAAVLDRGTGALGAAVDPVYSFGGAVSLVMGIFILGVVSAPDMARWAKTPPQAMAAGFVGFFFGNSIIVVVAIVLGRLMDADELMSIFFALGLGSAAVVVLILAQWTTNTTNIYSSALSFSAINRRLNRRTLTLVAGAVGVVVAALGAADHFVPFISAIGLVIAPFGGVYLAAFFADRRGRHFDAGAEVGAVNGWAVVAWVAGIAAAVLTTRPEDGLGLGLFDLTTVPALDGLIVGFVLSLVLALVRRRRDSASTADHRTDEVIA